VNRVFFRQSVVAFSAVAFLFIAVGLFSSLYWKGDTPGTVQDRVVVEQSASTAPPVDSAHNDSAVSQSMPKEDRHKPSIGVCRETWIGERNTPTYDCNVLFGPV
jgi:hypothetical protein